MCGEKGSFLVIIVSREAVLFSKKGGGGGGAEVKAPNLCTNRDNEEI